MNKKTKSIIACFLVCCLITINAIKPKTEAKAFNPIQASVGLTWAICTAMGMIATSNNATQFATEIYNSLTPDNKAVIDAKSAWISSGGNIEGVTLTRTQYDAFVQNIAQKFGWGATPPATYTDGFFGSVTTSTSAYSSNNFTSPINVSTLGAIGNKLGVFTYSWTFNGAGQFTPYLITCPDGFKVKLNLYQDSRINQIIPLTPCIYAGNNLKLFQKQYDTTLGWGYKDITGYWGDWSTSTDNGVTWVAWPGSGTTLYNVLMAHVGTATPASMSINPDAYNEAYNNPSQSTADLQLKVSTDMDKLIQYNADTIQSIDAVNDSVINLGGTITGAFNTVGTTIVNAVNALGTTIVNGINAVGTTIVNAVNAVTTAVNSIATSLYNAIVQALQYLFVPTVSLTAIKDIFMSKLGIVFAPQTSFGSTPISVDIPLGTYTQEMTLDNSLWSQFRTYMAGFVYLTFAWLFYRKVTSIGGND